MNKKEYTIEEITLLRDELPRGAMLEIAATCGMSAIYVRQVLSGKHYSEKIIEAAIAYRDARREKVKILRERILS